jgi:hypothetical protein
MKCKFKVKNKTEFDDGLANVHMEVTQDNCEENKAFFANNPNGYFDVMGIAPEVASQFVVGGEYFIDILPVK